MFLFGMLYINWLCYFKIVIYISFLWNKMLYEMKY